MDRPGLTALLADVAAGKVDVIVLYKIDRLTRRLTDFAKIVDQLDRAGASFVSVTQSFNTNTSMGRLMLHVLLSFAQFEREVGAERVRDKIAASKAKGMWMGGTVPLGYDAIDKKLIVNAVEADTVRTLFGKFVELGTVQGTLRWAQRTGLKTKVRQREGRTVGGCNFEYGSLRCLLSNRLYVGEVEHRGKIHAGQHAAILDRAQFDRAQEILATLTNDAVRGPKLVSASLLQGLIVDCHGRTMGPVHTLRRGQRFRYYVTHPKRIREGDPAAYRLAADALEKICCDMLAESWKQQVMSIDDSAEAERRVALLRGADHRVRRELVIELVRRVTIGDASLSILLNDGTLMKHGLERLRHGNDARLVIGEVPTEGRPVADPQLLVLLRDVYRAKALAEAKPSRSLATLAKQFGRSTERFKRLLRLSSLSPTIVEAIVAGQQPPRITNRFLQNLDRLPLSWAEQEDMLLR